MRIWGLGDIGDKSVPPKDREALQAVLSWNLERRHLSSSQKAAVGVELEPLFDALEAQAKERQRESATRNQPQNSQIFDYSERSEAEKNESKSTHKAAKTLGTNRQYISDAKKLKENAPKVHEAVKRGDANITQAKAIALIALLDIVG